MYNPGDDKELDRLSREAGDQYEVPGTPSWDKLLTELDHVMPVAEKRRRRLGILWWILPCLLAGIPAYLWLHQPQSNEQTAGTTAPAVRTQPAPAPAGQRDPGAAVNTHPPGKTDETQHNRIQLNKIVIDQKNTLNPVTRSSSSAFSAAVLPATVLPVEKNIPISQVDAKDGQATKQGTNPVSITNSNPVDTAGKQSAATITPETITAAKADTGNNAVTATDTIQENKKIIPPGTQRRKLSIGIVAGADLNNVKFRRASRVGYNVGLMAGYHFSNRWSVHTGAIYTLKNYAMDGADFTAPKGSPPSYWNLKTVEGDCSMWEMPLFARYSFGNKVNRRFFAAAGLSSYFMMSENYEYYYPSPVTGQIIKRNGSYNSGNTHWFSVAHFSTGLEQPVGRNLSMLFEPYIKLPLTGLGIGSIRLSSIGLNMTVQFRGSKAK